MKKLLIQYPNWIEVNRQPKHFLLVIRACELLGNIADCTRDQTMHGKKGSISLSGVKQQKLLSITNLHNYFVTIGSQFTLLILFFISGHIITHHQPL